MTPIHPPTSPSRFRRHNRSGAPAATAALHLIIYQDPGELSEAARALCPDAESDLFQSFPWVGTVTQAGMEVGDRLQLHLVVDGDAQQAPVALLPAVYSRLYGSHPGSRVLHFLQREEQPYLPLGRQLGVAETVAAWFDANPKAIDVVRVSPLDPDLPFTPEIIAALRRHGFWLQLYRHARSRYAVVAGMDGATYLAQRPRHVRESLDVNTRLLLQGGRGEFHFPCTPEMVKDAWGSVCYVVDHAPTEGRKDPRRYLRAMLDAAAGTGSLRLGLFSLDGLPVAMQLWVISGRAARCLRIWSAPQQKVFPIDQVLTQMMALCLIDGDGVGELEFGDVNDEFASEWAPLARERIGLAAFNRRTWRGVRGAIRHIGIASLKNAPQLLWRRLRGRR